jgi:hypothetical protein
MPFPKALTISHEEDFLGGLWASSSPIGNGLFLSFPFLRRYASLGEF